MMNDTKSIRSKWLTIRLSDDEFKRLQHLSSRTTSRSISEYVRSVILKEPTIVLYRNQTADNFLQEMIQLKKELNAIGTNLNQAVHKLHKLDHFSQINSWAILFETSKNLLMKKTEEIKEKLNEIHEIWLRK